ncbi:MAG: hypothetical protein TR69_WS6001001018 [candidate division WS6 bacterium OLB20]|uniref:Fibronectin type-III domain-containing protein n=1 Tax=candidate division WS6 bacterium OLB20 TaxID=1617426 RepID=A0A136LZB8_9BACT|nr:MAG: hypothetical protein TR69_WS6001001018 [candidate division WS6 bacterium OLB20]
MNITPRLQAGRILLGASIAVLVVSIVAFLGLYLTDDAGAVGNIRITNVTANGATISWTTQRPAAGKVFYSATPGSLPFLDRAGKALAVDDRDVVQNHEGAYAIKPDGIEERVTHHVTIRNLEPDTTYYFSVGENLRTFAGEQGSFTTGPVSEAIATPDPVYGAVYSFGDLKQPADGIVYYRVYAVDGQNEVSTQDYSSVLSETGTWTGDLGNNDTIVNGQDLKQREDASLWVEVKSDLGATQYSFPLEDYKPLPPMYVTSGFTPDGSGDSTEADTAIGDRSDNERAGLTEVLASVISPVGAQGLVACSGDYYEACGNGGQKLCHKRGLGPTSAGDSNCSWGPGSYCDACVEPGNPGGGSGSGGQTPPPQADSTCLAPGCSRAEGQVWIGSSSGMCRICNNGCTKAAPNPSACCSLLGPNDSRRAQNGCSVNTPPAAPPVTPPQEDSGGGSVINPANLPNGSACRTRDNNIECRSGICCDGLPASSPSGPGICASTCAVGVTPTPAPTGDTGSACTSTVKCPDTSYCDSRLEREFEESNTGIRTLNCVYAKTLGGSKTERALLYKVNNNCSLSLLGDGKEAEQAFCSAGTDTSPDPWQQPPQPAATCDVNSFAPCMPLVVGCGEILVSSNVVQSTGSPFLNCVYQKGDTPRGVSWNINTGNCTMSMSQGSQERIPEIRELFCGSSDDTQQPETASVVEIPVAPEEQPLDGESRNGSDDVTAVQNVLGAANTTSPVQPGVYNVVISGVKSQSVIITAENVSVAFFLDANGDGIKQETEEYVDSAIFEISLEKQEDVITYSLNEGWNLIGFPIVSENWTKASQLLRHINRAGVGVTHIASYDSSGWKIYSARVNGDGEIVEFGEDYNLVPGHALFIKSQQVGAFNLTGRKFAEPVPLNLERGWNLISVQSPAEYTAGSLISKCEAANMSCDTVSRYEAGRYENVVKDAGTLFGLDFNIITTRGYFVRVKDGQGGQFTP